MRSRKFFGTFGRGMSIFEVIVYCDCDFWKKEFLSHFLKFAVYSLKKYILLYLHIANKISSLQSI